MNRFLNYLLVLVVLFLGACSDSNKEGLSATDSSIDSPADQAIIWLKSNRTPAEIQEAVSIANMLDEDPLVRQFSYVTPEETWFEMGLHFPEITKSVSADMAYASFVVEVNEAGIEKFNDFTANYSKMASVEQVDIVKESEIDTVRKKRFEEFYS